jgi:hypothetical protein
LFFSFSSFVWFFFGSIYFEFDWKMKKKKKDLNQILNCARLWGTDWDISL